eukprot:891954-Pleurochrysis_carterae.AAC.1
MEVDSSLSRYSNPLGRGCRRQDEYSAFFVSQEACFRRRQRTPRYGLLAQNSPWHGGIAQLVERCLCKADASGSSPLTSSQASYIPFVGRL